MGETNEAPPRTGEATFSWPNVRTEESKLKRHVVSDIMCVCVCVLSIVLNDSSENADSLEIVTT